MLKPEELYEGFSKEQAETYHNEAVKSYGKTTVSMSEEYLQSLGKDDFEKLKMSAKKNLEELFSVRFEDPEDFKVQHLIEKHYKIIRHFWGTASSSDKQAEAYAGLGDVYQNDERFTMMEGKPQPDFAKFLNKAMKFFSKTRLA